MSVYNAEVLNQWHTAPLDYVVEHSIEKIVEWIEQWCGANLGARYSYITYSGGLDSTVLIDMIKRFTEYGEYIGEYLQIVFVDTGLEYPEVRKQALSKATIVLRPKLTFRQVLQQYGYPVVSKTQAQAIRKLTTQNLSEKYRNKLLHGDEKGKAGKLSDKFHYLLKAPFPISERCCDIMKKAPIHKFEHENNDRYLGTAITGERAEESENRKRIYYEYGCNAWKTKNPKSRPLSIWSHQHVLEYISRYKVPYASVYGEIKKDYLGRYYNTGVNRTGCMFCMFGCHLEKQPNRFQQMAVTHPKQYDHCINKLELGKVLDYMNVEYRPCGSLKFESDGQLKIV